MPLSSFLLEEGTKNGGGGGGSWEIEEEDLSAELGISRRGRSEAAEDVYVAVGNEPSSADALSWVLKNTAARPGGGGIVNLIHVFPEIRYIPTSLGMLPKSQASRRQLENYANQAREKRKEMLQKFLDMCNAAKVQVDTLLIESDSIAKTIIDLISVLQIRRLIIGISKPPKRSGGSSKAEQVHRGAPLYCEVAVIYKGKKLMLADRVFAPSSLPPNPENRGRGKMKRRPMAIERKKNMDLLLCYWFCNKARYNSSSAGSARTRVWVPTSMDNESFSREYSIPSVK